MAEFAPNNNKLVSIKVLTFFAIKDLHLYISFDKVRLFNINTCKRIFNQKTLNISENMQTS